MLGIPERRRECGLFMQKVDIKRHVVRLDKLPTLSSVATKLLKTTIDERADASKVAKIIETDQVLTSRILSLVNSPAYGFSGRIVSVDTAVSLLGFSTVRSVVLSLSLADVFPAKTNGKTSFDRVSFWKHSLACAVCAELIARKIRSDYVPEAFIAGLIHDIGKLALDMSVHDKFHRCIDTARDTGTYLVEAERDLLGTDHGDAGKWVAEKWGLPEALVETVWLHHQPAESLGASVLHKQLIEIVQAANAICRGLLIGASGDSRVAPVSAHLLASLRLKQSDIDKIRKKVIPEVEKRASMFDLEVNCEQMYLDSIQKANEELGRLALASEQLNKNLSGEVRVLSLLDKLNHRWRPGTPLDELLNTIVDLLRNGMGANRGLCLVVDTANKVLEGKVWKETDRDPLDLLLRLDDDANGRNEDIGKLDNRQAQTVRETALGLKGSGWVGAQVKDIIERNDLLVVPMVVDGNSVGQIMVDLNAIDQPPTDRQMRDYLAFASGAALAVARHMMQERFNARSEELAAAIWRQEAIYKQLMRSERLASVGKMAAGAAHEINNPLAVISGRAQILLEMNDDPKQRKALELIVDQAQRASKILTDLMGFARPAMPKTEPTNINYVIHQVVSMVENQLRVKNIVCVQNLAENLPKVLADRHQLEQVFLNLLINAEHAMEDGGTLTVSTGLSSDRTAVEIKIADTGKGIEPEHLDQIFEPFFTTKEEGKGTGLGLSMCYGIITSHKGTISVESTVGQGTTFTIKLPVPGQAAAAEPTAAAVSTERDDDARATILVVDDEPNIRDILAETLINLGFHVLTAEHGVAALSVIKREHVDVMLLDMRMPLKDGLSLLTEIKDMLPSLPVVIITGLASHEEVEEALRIGAFSCIRKPFNIETLKTEVEKALTRDSA